MKGGDMGKARDVMDRVTAAMESNDREAAKALYASDAVAETPDEGTLHGADAIAGWLVKFGEAFPDAKYEQVNGFEIGDTAVDEGFLTGTNTGPLPMPGGESVPPTGKAIRLRACDLATVKDGAITSHRFYFDQMEFLSQLGLAG
jgi:ketosteroid isomerase-like protein